MQSIYLEAADARSYQEKINSDFFKTKFRVRWYETKEGRPYGDADQLPVFLEKKMKVGSKRLKRRWASSTVFNELKKNSLNSAFHGNWYRQFSEQTGVYSVLQPLIQISYSRKRFIDPSTGVRISLDCHIKVERSFCHHLQTWPWTLVYLKLRAKIMSRQVCWPISPVT